MVPGVIFTCVVAAFIGACFTCCSKSSMNVASMLGSESSQAAPAVLQNVPFPSKLKTKGF